MLECTEYWIVDFTNHQSEDIIHADFSRAYASTVFAKLTAKLEFYGSEGILLTSITAFLRNCIACVVLENYFSAVANFDSRVVQSLVLGPTFLIFNNDITFVCNDNVTVKLFADDVKLYSVIDI